MRIPSYDERLGFLEHFGSTPEDASVFTADKNNRMSMARTLIGLLPGYLLEIDITRIVDSCRLTCLEDIKHECALAQSLLPELGFWLLGKHNISNPSVPS